VFFFFFSQSSFKHKEMKKQICSPLLSFYETP